MIDIDAIKKHFILDYIAYCPIADFICMMRIAYTCRMKHNLKFTYEDAARHLSPYYTTKLKDTQLYLYPKHKDSHTQLRQDLFKTDQ